MRLKQIIFSMITLTLFLGFSAEAYADFNPNLIRQHVRSMAYRLGIESKKIDDLIFNLDKGMANPWFRDQMRNRRIKGVLVFEAGEGGLIVKYLEGEGLVRFAGLDRVVPIFIKSWGIGANIGGGAKWGVGLITDIRKPSEFGGDYDGKTQSATAGDITTYNWVVLQNTRIFHQVFLLQTGRGFGAGAGIERLTITPRW